jgi:hypothetical protein
MSKSFESARADSTFPLLGKFGDAIVVKVFDDGKIYNADVLHSGFDLPNNTLTLFGDAPLKHQGLQERRWHDLRHPHLGWSAGGPRSEMGSQSGFQGQGTVIGNEKKIGVR